MKRARKFVTSLLAVLLLFSTLTVGFAAEEQAVAVDFEDIPGRFSSVLPAGSIKLGERLQTIIMQGVALCVLFLGISGSLSGQNSLITILAMVLGAIIGELLDLDKRMMALGDWVQKHTARLSARIASLPLLSTSPPLCWAPMLVKTLGFTCKLRFSASNLLRCRLRCWQVQGH